MMSKRKIRLTPVNLMPVFHKVITQSAFVFSSVEEVTLQTLNVAHWIGRNTSELLLHLERLFGPLDVEREEVKGQVLYH